MLSRANLLASDEKANLSEMQAAAAASKAPTLTL